MDNGRSILLFFFLANLTCFVTFMHRSNNIVMHTKIKANCICRKYKETAENTKNDSIISSHITKITTSTLHPKQHQPKVTLEVISHRLPSQTDNSLFLLTEKRIQSYINLSIKNVLETFLLHLPFSEKERLFYGLVGCVHTLL